MDDGYGGDGVFERFRLQGGGVALGFINAIAKVQDDQ
jgi:hypothetical protein